MPYQVTSAPAAEPLTASDIREDYLHIDTSAEDNYINALIKTVTDYYERQFDKAIVSQEITETFDHFNCGKLELTVSPVISVDSLTYIASDGSSTPLTEGTHFYVTKSNIGCRITLDGSTSVSLKDRPDAITVVYTAGYSTIPENIKHSISEKVARMYYMREENMEMALGIVFSSSYQLINPERKMVV